MRVKSKSWMTEWRQQCEVSLQRVPIFPAFLTVFFQSILCH